MEVPRLRDNLPHMPFLQRRLDVFQMAVDWVVRVEHETRSLPRQWWWLRDQLLRASGSIPLNIAEGAGRPGTPNERKHYNIARDSAGECDACIAILQCADQIDDGFAAEAEDTLNRMSAMLRGLITHSADRSKTNPRR